MGALKDCVINNNRLQYAVVNRHRPYQPENLTSNLRNIARVFYS